MRCSFSERTFEFCFNAEFCQSLGGLLAAHPNIPSQNLEKDLGYDVEFKIRQEGYSASIFFQHKVASFAENRVGTNTHFFDAHGGPYFRFPVDNEQHNLLCDLSASKGNAFYCAPSFHQRNILGEHFFNHCVGDNSVLVDPADVGPIVDAQKHSISYAINGAVVLHSEERRFSKSYTGGKARPPEYRRRKIDESYVKELQVDLFKRSDKRRRARRHLSVDVEALRPVEQVQLLLAREFDVSWVLLK